MTILLIYPIGAGGEFIGCTVNPVPSQWYGNEHVSSINRYYYKGNELFSDESASVLYQQSLSFQPPYDTINGAANLKKKYRDFINIESHHFSQEGWRAWDETGWNVHSESSPDIRPREDKSTKGLSEEIGFTGYIFDPMFFYNQYDSQPIIQYQYDNQSDIKEIIQEPLELETPILVLHNHCNIHKFFKDIKAYGLISNSYALRLVWAMCAEIKSNPHLYQTGFKAPDEGLDSKYTIEWMNALGEIDGDYYLDLEAKDKPLHEDYKARVKEDDIELITPAELDHIQPGLAKEYKEYTERNVELIIEKLPDYNFNWIDKIEYT